MKNPTHPPSPAPSSHPSPAATPYKPSLSRPLRPYPSHPWGSAPDPAPQTPEGLNFPGRSRKVPGGVRVNRSPRLSHDAPARDPASPMGPRCSRGRDPASRPRRQPPCTRSRPCSGGDVPVHQMPVSGWIGSRPHLLTPVRSVRIRADVPARPRPTHRTRTADACLSAAVDAVPRPAAAESAAGEEAAAAARPACASRTAPPAPPSSVPRTHHPAPDPRAPAPRPAPSDTDWCQDSAPGTTPEADRAQPPHRSRSRSRSRSR